jgi:hypothetical protein
MTKYKQGSFDKTCRNIGLVGRPDKVAVNLMLFGVRELSFHDAIACKCDLVG